MLDREWRTTGREDEFWAQIETWEETGYLPLAWRHPEPGTDFDALGPPRSTARLYYAEHAGQIVLLHARHGKAGRGKLEARTRELLSERLRRWREWFPLGAEIDDEGRLTRRSERRSKR